MAKHRSHSIAFKRQVVQEFRTHPAKAALLRSISASSFSRS